MSATLAAFCIVAAVFVLLLPVTAFNRTAANNSGP